MGNRKLRLLVNLCSASFSSSSLETAEEEYEKEDEEETAS